MVPTDFPTAIQPLPNLDKIFAQDFKDLPALKGSKLEDRYDHTRQNVNNYQIAYAFQPLLRTMQIVGSFPIQIKTVDGAINYHFRISSFAFLYCLLTISTLIGLSSLVALNRELEIDWPIQLFSRATNKDGIFQGEGAASISDVPQSLLTVDRIIQMAVPLFILLNLIGVRIRVLHFMKFLSNWSKVLQEFELTFSPCYTIQLKALLRFRRAAVPFLVVFYVVSIIGTQFQPKLLVTDNWFPNFIFKSYFTIFMATGLFLSTLVTVLSLLTLKTVYREIGNGISAQYKTLNQSISYVNVKSWTKLVSLARAQVDIFQKFSSMPELNDLLFTFLTVLGLSYVVFTLYLDNIEGGGSIVPAAIGALLVGLTRTYLKGYLAEKITEEEQRIGMMVIAMKVANSDSEAQRTRLETKILCNMIFTNPIQITFGNIIVINKKLLLAIVSQLASYLVVFLQFKKNSST